jgi:TolB-like protein/DNA-binding winged helix-turn-helix (wHTH) protein/Flp pilus assembly protein TadD
MAVQVSKRFVLGDYNLEPDKRLLYVGDDSVHLANGPFQVLLYLIENRDRVVTRNELLDRFWDGKDVYDDSVRKCIGAIRKALNDRSENPRFIETHYAGGYRYIGPVEEQLVQPYIVEIEKTRGVKIVIEEEEIQEAVSGSAVASAFNSSVSPSKVIKSTRKRQAVAVAMIMVVLTIAAVSVFRKAGSNASSASPIRSIAVVPLKNLTGDPAQEYFSDGMTESFITELSRISELKVISRASAFTFKDGAVDPRDVGRRLGVAAVLEGSVERSGDRVRVAVRLVSVADGRVIWASNNYDRALKDVFAVQDEISCSVAASLKLMLCSSEKSQKPYTDNVEAYQAYLQGLYHLNKRKGEDLKKAIANFQQAVAIDPNYALAYAGLAECYNMGMWYIPLEPRVAIAKSKAAALKAIALDDGIAEAHEALAAAYSLDWDWTNTRKEQERAIEINPSYAQAYHAYSLYLNIQKEPDDAIAEVKHAQELDPLSLPILTDVGMAYCFAHRYDEAVAAYKKAIELDPTYAVAHADLADAYWRMGMYDEALKAYETAIGLAGRTPSYVCSLGLIYASAGRRAEAQKMLDELNQMSEQRYVPPALKAMLYAAFGQRDQAFSLLEEARAEHSPQLMNLLVEQGFDPLRPDPRFADLLRRVGLPQS